MSGMLERFLKVRSELPGLQKLVLMDDPDGLAPSDVVPFADLLGAAPVDLDQAAGRVRPEDLATLIYTSGTTGPPKGVMISHYNLCWVLESMNRANGEPVTGWRQVSYLPMAHIAERWLTHYLHIGEGTEVTTCPEPTELASYLREVRPEHFLGVPRVWEKLYAGIMAAVSADPEKQAGFERALEVGDKAAAVRVTGQPLPPGAGRRLGAGRRRRLRQRPGHGRPRPDARRHHRRGADPPARCSTSSWPSACRSPRCTACRRPPARPPGPARSGPGPSAWRSPARR